MVVSLTVTTYVDKYMLLRVVNSKSLLFYDDSGAVAAVNFVGFMTVITSTAGFVITSVMRSKIDGISLQVSFAASILVSIQSNPIHLKTNSTQLNSIQNVLGEMVFQPYIVVTWLMLLMYVLLPFYRSWVFRKVKDWKMRMNSSR